ncbi:MAG: hypothetical protein JWO38_6033 [Gemmataceae bacterium]|nr:hypothetical protein [Gemmataceae bacterium]
MPPTTATTAPPAERRVALRRQPAMGTVCQFDLGPSGKPALGLVWNISTTGLSVLLPEPREVGTLLAGDLETVGGGSSLPVAMHVVHLKPLETGDYFLGAHFTRPLTPDELSRFVA